MNEYTVGQLARLSRVSVRTLHHYDAVGVLSPGGRSEAGYRLYSEDDLSRLRQVLFYRELGFALADITAMLADPDAEIDDHLRRQHRLLRERLARDEALLAAIEKEMEARQMGISLTPEEQFEIFDTDRLEEHMEEARERWGDSEAFKESQRRAAAYTKEDWITIKREADEIMQGFARAMRAGEPAKGQVAMDLAEAHRRHTSRWFYECGHRQHRDLANLYVSDRRYMADYDEIEPGFSQYVHDAIYANVDRARDWGG